MLKLKLKNIYKPVIFFHKRVFKCQIGKNGVLPAFKKKEGDFGTPKGKWKLGKIFYRRDKHRFLKLHKFVKKNIYPIKKNHGWSDDKFSFNYNKLLDVNKKFNFKTRHENLFRNDDVYDIIVEIKYNVTPTIKGKGSAIFIHCSFKDKRPTKGCVAIEKKELIYILNRLDKYSKLEII